MAAGNLTKACVGSGHLGTNVIMRSREIWRWLFRLRCLVEKWWLLRRAGVTIGKFTYGTPRIHGSTSLHRVSIGRFCSISSNVHLFVHADHRVDWITTYPFPAMLNLHRAFAGHPSSKGSIVIGNDVWIGFGAMILSGVTIGDGAVIGAGSVVAKDVEPYEIVAGNPAKRIRHRFDEFTIGRLIQLRWWDLDEKELRPIMPLLLSDRADEFIEAVCQRRA